MTAKSYKTEFDHNLWIKNWSDLLASGRSFLREAGKTLSLVWSRAKEETTATLKGFIRHLNVFDMVFGGLTVFAMFIASLVLLAGCGLLGYQVFLWLKEGVWTAFPLMVIFNFLFEGTLLHQWIVQPESWFGLQQILAWTLENVPLTLVLIAPSVLFILAMGALFGAMVMIRFYQFKKAEKNEEPSRNLNLS